MQNNNDLQAMSNNFLGFFRLQSCSPFSFYKETEELQVLRTGIPNVNRLTLKQALAPAKLEAFIREQQIFFKNYGEQFLLSILPAAVTPETAGILTNCGLSLAYDLYCMAWHSEFTLPKLSPSAMPRRIHSEADLEQWQNIASCAYPFGAENTSFARTLLQGMLKNDKCYFYLYPAEGTPTTCSLMIYDGANASPYWLATLPEHRGHADYKNTIKGFFIEAATKRLGNLYCQCVDGPHTLYRRLGAIDCGRMQSWK